MASPKSTLWVPERRELIWVDFSPQVGDEMKRERGARPHHWKQVTPALFRDACDELNKLVRCAQVGDDHYRCADEADGIQSWPMHSAPTSAPTSAPKLWKV